MSTTMRRQRTWDLPLTPGVSGNVELSRLVIDKDSPGNLHAMLHGRGCDPGTYWQLRRNGRLWMSDTTAERRDHYAPDYQIYLRGGRILIGGLGLGMIVWRALQCENVEHIDIVEIDEDVIRLVGPAYESDPRVTIHHGDMYEMKWPPGTRWSVAWFDIWPDISTDDLADMSRLLRSYGRRADWKGCWGREMLLRRRRAEGAWGW